jgi:molybdopterin converting factor small subunit
MRIKVLLRGFLVKYFDGEKERVIELEDGLSAREVVERIGIPIEHKSFGFVAVNGMRVMIDERLKDGDELKIYPRLSGG